MNKVESIEKEVRQLKTRELAAFRKWFLEFDAEAWDTRIKLDAKSGRLDQLAKKSLKDQKEGKSSMF